ncbi:MAG TPA: hypothetical protein VIG80_11530 [Bacillaceae bacterium]
MDKAAKNQMKEKEAGWFQRFIFWVLIPLLFALFLGLLAATAAGVNVFEKAREIGGKTPVIKGFLDSSENAGAKKYEDRIVQLEAQIQDKSLRLEQLEKELEKRDTEKERLLLEQEQLEKTIEEMRQIQNENKRAFKEIVSTYETMTPKTAAPILLEMKEEEAVKIMSNMSTEGLAKIMEKMPPERAAKYFEKLSAKSE